MSRKEKDQTAKPGDRLMLPGGGYIQVFSRVRYVVRGVAKPIVRDQSRRKSLTRKGDQP